MTGGADTTERVVTERVVIVNADDLGRTPAVDDGIFEAHRRGIVTSATMMMGFATAETGRRLAEHPDLGVGLHVTLTGARPTLPASEIPSLVDDEGRLARRPEVLATWTPEREEIAAEVRHQLELFRRLTGRDPTHLDGHHHCLRLPPVLDVFVELAHELDVPVRRASARVAERLIADGLRTTDVFVERFYGEEVRDGVLQEIFADLPAGTSEVMCHPGRVDETLRQESNYADERELELRLLTDPGLPAWLAEHGIRLAHFGDLPAGA